MKLIRLMNIVMIEKNKFGKVPFSNYSNSTN